MITSSNNPRSRSIRKLQKSRQERWEKKQFIIEGVRLVREALKAMLPIELVLYTADLGEEGQALLPELARLGAEVQVVSERVMRACADTETPSGLLAIMPFPILRRPQEFDLVLVVDRLADPGNLGTMLRTALAAGVQVVFLIEGSVDPFNPIVVRAAMGAHFFLPMEILSVDLLLKRLGQIDLWLAEKGNGMMYDKVDWRSPCGLIIGSEAHGAGKSLRSLVAKRIQIPMRGAVDSLNASIAAAIILFEIVRQREAR